MMIRQRQSKASIVDALVTQRRKDGDDAVELVRKLCEFIALRAGSILDQVECQPLARIPMMTS
jgi:hypothetical protein